MAQGVTIDFNANLARFTSAIDKATNDLSRFQSNAQRRANNLKRIFSGLGVSLGALGIGSLGGQLVDINRRFESLKVSLVAVTGSTREANEAFANVSQFARQTPFQLEEVVTAFRKMSALGLRPSMEDLESFGNTASAMGRSLDQFVEAIADASTGEFERLKEFGIKTRKQGDDVSFTFQGVTKTVRNNSREIVGYLRDIGNVQFAGAMERQMDTLDGAFSNLADAVDQFAVSIGESGLNSVVADLTNSFTELVRESTNFIRGFQDASRFQSISQVEARIESLNETIKENIDTFRSFNLDQLNPFAKAKDLADLAAARKELEALQKRLAELKAEQEDFAFFSTEATTAINKFVDGVFGADEPVKKLGKAVNKTARDLSTMGRALDLIDAQFEELEDQEARRFAGLLPLDFDEARQELENFSRDITRQFNPADAVAEQLSMIEEAFSQGLISPEVYFQAVISEMDRLGESTNQTAEKMNEFAVQAARNIQGAFADFLFDPFDQGLQGMLDGFLSTLRRMAAEAASQKILTSIFTAGTNLGGFIGDLSAELLGGLTPRALGGPVTAGAPYLVGERGPELFVPGQSGRIDPNGRTGMSISQTINVNVSGSVDRQSTQQLQNAIGQATSRAMRRNA